MYKNLIFKGLITMMQLNVSRLYKLYAKCALISAVSATLLSGCGGDSSLPTYEDPSNPGTPATSVTIDP